MAAGWGLHPAHRNQRPRSRQQRRSPRRSLKQVSPTSAPIPAQPASTFVTPVTVTLHIRNA
eukprot:4300973-Pyramimonas_sp.AAC.1